MKRVEYFNTKEELERYYENGVPSTVLAIVQPDAETAAVLYTSSNNSPINPGQTEEQGGETDSIPDTPWIELTELEPILEDPKSYEFPLHIDATNTSISSSFSIVTKDGEIDYVHYLYTVNVNEEDVLIDVIVHDNSNGNIIAANDIVDALSEYEEDIYGNLYVRLTDCTLSKYSSKNVTKSKVPDYILEGTIYAWNLRDNAYSVEEITKNGFYLNMNECLGFNVNVAGANGTLLTEVFGADENNYKVYIKFNETDDSFTYSFDCTWDGENWTGSLSNNGFALVGRMGQATQYDYDSDSGKMVEHNSYTAIQMHIANGALYLGDVFAETGESLSDDMGTYTIAVDMWPNTKFLNNGFGAGPENLDMTGWKSGTLTFILTVPKNLAINYDTGYDYIGDGEVREIEHPCVYLKWEWRGVPEK